MSAERAKKGLCGLCDNQTEHGPWTDDQIAEAIRDAGIAAAEFEDWCDDCFVECIACGDAAYAARLLKRPVKLRKPENVSRALLQAR